MIKTILIAILFILFTAACVFGNDFKCCNEKTHTNICRIKNEYNDRHNYHDKPNKYYHDHHGHELARTYIRTYRGRYRVVHRRIETHDSNGRALY